MIRPRRRFVRVVRFAPGILAALTAALAPPVAAQLAVVRQGPESRAAQETGDGFGFALASGDFDGDGYMDVASGAPYDTLAGGFFQNGAVVVSFGGPYGLAWKGAELLLPTDDLFVQASDQAWFGYALAAGDLNGDGVDDLAVGAPLLDRNGVPDTGAVYVYLGGAGTFGDLEGQVPLVLDQNDFAAAIEQGDLFGSALWIGALDDDAYDDLLIGGPGENLGSGAIYGGYGAPGVLVPDVALTISAAEAGAAAQVNDGFGTRITVGDILRGPEADIVVGVPFEDDGSLLDAGAVYVIPMENGSPLSASTFTVLPTLWNFARLPNAWFGMGIAAGDFELDGDVTLDLAIGAPGENQGRLYLLDGDPVTPGVGDLFGQNRSDDLIPPVTDAEDPEPGDHFGWSLLTLDHDGDGLDDLAVSSPGESIPDFDGTEHSDTGCVVIFYSHPLSIGWAGSSDFYTERDLSTLQLGNARTGEALAAGDDDDGPGQSLFVGAPGWNANTGHYFDIAPWRQVYGLSANSAVAAGCSDVVYYALRPFDAERTASTGKIMTTLLACEAAQLPPADPDHVGLGTTYAIPQWLDDAFDVTSCSSFGFQLGEVMTFETLIRLTMMISANDATYGIADLVDGPIAGWSGAEGTAAAFVARMNARATQIGMTNTTFGNPSGVDTQNQWSCAYDMFLLLEEAMQNPLFQDFAGTTDYVFDRQIPDSQGFTALDTILSYNWLKTMQGLVDQTVGGKPGSTSVLTRAAAARQEESPWGTTYALAYGVPSQQGGQSAGGKANGYAASLLQLALGLCDPTIAVGGFPATPDLTAPQTVDDVDLDLPLDPTTFCVDLHSRPVGVLDDPELDELVLDASTTGSTKIEVHLSCSSLSDAAPGVFSRSGVVGYESHEGIRIANPDPVSPLGLTIQTTHPPQSFDLELLPLGSTLIAPDASGDGVGTFELLVRNNEPVDRDIQVDATWSYQTTFSPTSATLVMTLLVAQDLVRHMACVEVEALTDPSPLQEMALTVKEPADPFLWQPCTAEWSSYGAGWPGELGVPPLTLDGPPVLGGTVVVEMGSSSSAPVPGFLLIGPAPAAAATPWGGTQLVAYDTLLPLVVLPTGLDLPIGLPSTALLCGLAIHGQLVLIDPFASAGVSFSRGVELELGG